jgi:hypothetical protein
MIKTFDFVVAVNHSSTSMPTPNSGCNVKRYCCFHNDALSSNTNCVESWDRKRVQSVAKY